MSRAWSMMLHVRRLLFLGVMVALVGSGCSGGGNLGGTALAQQSRSLQSLAAEGALLAQDTMSGRTTRVYTREHSTDLYKAAAQAAASLKAAKTKPELEPSLRELAVLATRVRADLRAPSQRV